MHIRRDTFGASGESASRKPRKSEESFIANSLSFLLHCECVILVYSSEYERRTGLVSCSPLLPPALLVPAVSRWSTRVALGEYLRGTDIVLQAASESRGESFACRQAFCVQTRRRRSETSRANLSFWQIIPPEASRKLSGAGLPRLTHV